MTKDALVRFIDDIDAKLAELRRAVEQLPDTMDASREGALADQGRENAMHERSRVTQFVDKATSRPVVTKSFGEMNIRGEPIGAENVQAMIAACGVRPEDNAFSRDILEMREK